MKINKKILCLCLSLITVCSSSLLSFADGNVITSNLVKENGQVEILSNNRYYYETETGRRTLKSTKVLTSSESRNQDAAYGAVIAILAAGGVVGIPTSVAWAVGGAIYDTRAGTIKLYTTDSTRYKVNRLTGERHIDSKSKLVEIEVYVDGDLHRSFEHNLRLK